MPFSQSEVRLRGHAIEVRVNAEDPWKFTPSPGRITGYHAPGGPGIRVDSAVHEGAMVQPYYDSLTAKIIAYAPDRESAIRKLQAALDEVVVEGIRTSIPLQKLLLADPVFAGVTFHTRYIDEWLKGRPS
jgi:acetyl-CoA carboxylase biotin carboxylase subunit